MAHVFQTSLSQFRAAETSVNSIAEFLRQRLNAPDEDTVPYNSLKGA